MEILPAVMPESYDDLREKLSQVSNLVPWVQIDVMDGKFVPSRSWPYGRNDQDFSKVLEEQEGLPFWDRLNFELDLMVENPEEEANKWIQAGASRIVLHLESLKNDPDLLLEEIRGGGVETGLALDMKTPIEEIVPFIEKIDFVQLMGIENIGYQGEPFNARVIEKIKELKEKSPSTLISVDGGVSLETAPALIGAGAERLVAGSAVFESGDIVGTIREFQNL